MLKSLRAWLYFTPYPHDAFFSPKLPVSEDFFSFPWLYTQYLQIQLHVWHLYSEIPQKSQNPQAQHWTLNFLSQTHSSPSSLYLSHCSSYNASFLLHHQHPTNQLTICKSCWLYLQTYFHLTHLPPLLLWPGLLLQLLDYLLVSFLTLSGNSPYSSVKTLNEFPLCWEDSPNFLWPKVLHYQHLPPIPSHNSFPCFTSFPKAPI